MAPKGGGRRDKRSASPLDNGYGCSVPKGELLFSPDGTFDPDTLRIDALPARSAGWSGGQDQDELLVDPVSRDVLDAPLRLLRQA